MPSREEKQMERLKNRIRKRNVEVMLLSGQNIEPRDSSNDADDDVPPAKLAKALSRQVADERDKREGPELVLALQKLGGRNPNSHDIASLLHYTLIGSYVGKPPWLFFKNLRKHLQTVLLRVNCLEKHLKNTGRFINEFFEKRWFAMEKEVCNRDQFWNILTRVKQTKLAMLKQKIAECGDILEQLRGNDIKQSLLMSLDSMINHNYPINEEEVAVGSGEKIKIIPTKTHYRRVTRDSPIFFIDCEMCMTSEKCSELTRVSIINEKVEILMDTLVKPFSKITNYLTEHSGITEEMLIDVNVRLIDVQRAIRKLLPPDAILCGHSLEFDLRALQMSHPFCIDLSVLYNFSNNPRMKTSLRTLSQIFLHEDIQKTKSGHCSMEDSLATLKLLQLKMEQGLVFGNVMLGWSFKDWGAKNGLTELGTQRAAMINEARKLVEKKEKASSAEQKRPLRTCSQCGKALWIKCELEDCLCMRLVFSEQSISESESNTSSELSSIGTSKQCCVLCMSSSGETDLVCSESQTEALTDNYDNVDEAARENGNTEKAKSDPDELDFRSALRIDQGIQLKLPLSDMLKSNENAKTNMLCAIASAAQFMSPNKRCRVVSCDDLPTLEKIVPSAIEHNAAILEAACDNADITSDQIDSVVQAVVDSTCINGLVAVVLASPKRSLLYIKLKK